MNRLQFMQRIIANYYSGIYTLGEMFGMLAANTPLDMCAQAIELLPESMRGPFRDWVEAYLSATPTFPIGPGDAQEPTSEVLQEFQRLLRG